MPTKPRRAVPHVETCPDCWRAAHAALAHVRTLSALILEGAARPFDHGDKAQEARVAALLADLGVEMATTFEIMDDLMNASDGEGAHGAPVSAPTTSPTTN
jgi:hypothetical protein